MITTVILGSIIAILLYLHWKTQTPENFPPGPKRWPIIGHLLLVLNKRPMQENLYEISKKLGPIIGLNFGGANCIAVNGYDLVQSVCARDDCALRPDGLLFRVRSFHKRLGVLFSDGPLWREQRRFSLRHLRDFGFGKRSLEGLMHEEIDVLLEGISKRSKQESFDTGIFLNDLYPISVINVLWAIMAGKRYEHDDKAFQRLMNHVNDFFRYGSPTGGLMILPILRFVPIVNAGYKKQVASVHALQDYVMRTIKDHEVDFAEDSPRDFIDVFLREMKAHEGDVKSSFTKEQLVVLCMDLFLAGTETTSSVLSYLILYMILHPEVQEKARNEIHKEVGKDRLPSLEDMPNLPYIQALFHEVLRHASVVAMTPPHFTRTRIQLNGYDIPKNTLILVNIYSVLMEESHWGDPQNFRPERFINADGKFVKDERLIAFGTGPRFCLGEPLARSSTFLFGSALLQRFKFSQPKDAPKPCLDHLQGFTTAPRPYRVAITSAI